MMVETRKTPGTFPYMAMADCKKTRGPSRLTRQQQQKADKVPEAEVERVYQYWCSTMRPGRTRVPALDTKRYLKVAAAVADYGVDDCLKAIRGCAASDFHMGRNKQNKRYDDLELIFRDQTHVERFLECGASEELSGEEENEWA
jgi:hypothetical protein